MNSIVINKCKVEVSKNTNNEIRFRITPKRNKRLQKKVKNSVKEVVEELRLLKPTESISVKSNPIDIDNNTEVSKEYWALKRELIYKKSDVKSSLRFTDVDSTPEFVNSKCDYKKDASCFSSDLYKYVEKNISYPVKAISNKIEGEVWARFVINEGGSISDLKLIGPDKNLESEVESLILRLPKLKPAKLKGKPVKTKFGFPVNFSLN